MMYVRPSSQNDLVPCPHSRTYISAQHQTIRARDAQPESNGSQSRPWQTREATRGRAERAREGWRGDGLMGWWECTAALIQRFLRC
jgi:hypothetical protein